MRPTGEIADKVSAHTQTHMAATPLERLREATKDGSLVKKDDLKALLVAHAVQADQQARALASYSEQMLQMLFEMDFSKSDDEDGAGPLDAAATLDTISRLSRLHHGYATEARKDIALLDRLTRPRSPGLKVYAAGDQVNVGAAQMVNKTRGADRFRRDE